MSNRDRSVQLSRIVENAIEEYGLDMFAQYWELYEETADTSKIEWFYLNVEPQQPLKGGYCNVAIIGGGLLIDVEGDDTNHSGSLSLGPLESFSSVAMQKGALPGLSHSQDASLVVIADRIGENNIGLYWVAKTEDEEERLIRFARALVKAFADR